MRRNPLGRTGELLSKVAHGPHRIAVSADGFRPDVQEVFVRSRQRSDISVDLEPQSGALTVAAELPGEWIHEGRLPDSFMQIMDGHTRQISELPIVTNVPTGVRHIALTARGCESSPEQSIQVGDREVKRAAFTLTPKDCTVVFDTNLTVPVEIYENDILLGHVGERITLSPFKPHRITLKPDGHAAKIMKITSPKPGVTYKKPMRVEWPE